MSQLGTGLLGLAVVLYPLLVWLGLERWQPRGLGLVLIALLALRVLFALRTRRSLLLPALASLLAAGTLALAAALTNSETLLRLYPALINAGLLLVFAGSLLSPRSLIERLARLQEPDLPPSGVAYTRRVTQIWCGFFIVNGAIAAWTALAASRSVWALYNGAIAYGLMGLLFAGEYWVRRRVRGRAVEPS